MPITLIAAIDRNSALGYQNQLLCTLKKDMEHFKQLTMGNHIVMGRKTFESIGRALPGRTNLVLTRDTEYDPYPDIHVYDSVSDILWEYEEYSDSEADLYVIGGSQVYSQFLPYADTIELTIINHSFPNADVFFPQFSMDDFRVVSNIFNPTDEENEYDHYFVKYKRRLYK